MAHIAGEQFNSWTLTDGICHSLGGFPGMLHERGILGIFGRNGHPKAESVRLVLWEFDCGGSTHEVESPKKVSGILQKLTDHLALSPRAEAAVQVMREGGADISFGHPFANQAGIGVSELMIRTGGTLRENAAVQPGTVVARGFEIAGSNRELDESRVFAVEETASGLVSNGCCKEDLGKGFFGKIRLDEIAILGEDNQEGLFGEVRQGWFYFTAGRQRSWRQDGSLSPADFFQCLG